MTCWPPISPACRIASTPCSAASASGRIRPCVSEMTPIFMVARLRRLLSCSVTELPRNLATLCPDRRLLRPDRLFVSILERLRGGFEGARIVTRLVPRNACPVHGLCRGVAAGHLLAHIAELALSVRVIAFLELRVAEAELQMAEEFFGREEALDAIQLLALAVDEQNRRRPVDSEAHHRHRMFFHMQANGNEVVDNERGDARIRINLGFQSS